MGSPWVFRERPQGSEAGMCLWVSPPCPNTFVEPLWWAQYSGSRSEKLSPDIGGGWSTAASGASNVKWGHSGGVDNNGLCLMSGSTEPGSTVSFPHNSVTESQPVAVQLDKKRQKNKAQRGCWVGRCREGAQSVQCWIYRAEDPNRLPLPPPQPEPSLATHT